MRSQFPQAYLFYFHCTTHSDEPPLELAVPKCKNSFKIASQWNFCTPESCSYGLSSKCFDLIQNRLPQFGVSSTSCKGSKIRHDFVRAATSLHGVMVRTFLICRLKCFAVKRNIGLAAYDHSSSSQLRRLSGEVRACRQSQWYLAKQSETPSGNWRSLSGRLPWS